MPDQPSPAPDMSALERSLYIGFLLLIVQIGAFCCLSVYSLTASTTEQSRLTERYAQALTLAKDTMFRRGHADAVVLQARDVRPASLSTDRALTDFLDYEFAQFLQQRVVVNRGAARLEREVTLGAVLVSLALLTIGALLVSVTRHKRARDRELRRLYDDQKKLAEARQIMLESVSHDLRSPLVAIGLSLEFAQRQIALDNLGKATTAMDLGRRAAHTMTDLVETLLDQAKLESGAFPLVREPQGMGDVLEEARQLFEPQAREKSITVTVDHPPGLPPVLLDHRQMLRAVSNILGNALKFTPSGGRVSLRVTLDDTRMRVSIADTGPGIAPEELARIFERFWQAGAARGPGTGSGNGSGAGSGLGLAIARSVIEAHGGAIWASSDVGRGTTLHFVIPLGAATPGTPRLAVPREAVPC